MKSARMEELWMSIPGYEGLYEVSNLGQVRSLDRLRKNVKGMAKINGRIITGNHGGKHYYQVALHKDGKKKYMNVHRLVAEAFIPNPDGKSQVNHIDGNKQNNVVSNLEWVTPSENILHSFRTGLNSHSGEKNVNAKLTREIAAEIKKSYVKGRRGSGATALAKKYGVTKTTVLSVIWGKTWKGA